MVGVILGEIRVVIVIGFDILGESGSRDGKQANQRHCEKAQQLHSIVSHRSEISCARRRQVRQSADCALLRCRDSFGSWRPSRPIQQASPAILSVPYPNSPTNLLFFAESKPTPWSTCVLGD